MTEDKTTYDVARELQDIISVELTKLTNYQLLIVLCDYSEYYKTRVQSAMRTIKQEVAKIEEDLEYTPTSDDIPCILFNKWYEQCGTELEYLENHTQTENQEFIAAIDTTINNPEELLNNVKSYIEEN